MHVMKDQQRYTFHIQESCWIKLNWMLMWMQVTYAVKVLLYCSCLSICREDGESPTIFMLQLCVYFARQRGVFPPMFISLFKRFVKFSHFQLLSHSLNGHMFTISYTVGYRKLLALNKVNVDITENATCILNIRKYVCFLLKWKYCFCLW